MSTNTPSSAAECQSRSKAADGSIVTCGAPAVAFSNAVDLCARCDARRDRLRLKSRSGHRAVSVLADIDEALEAAAVSCCVDGASVESRARAEMVGAIAAAVMEAKVRHGIGEGIGA